MHVYPEPFLFMRTTAFCMEIVEDWKTALKVGALISASSPFSERFSRTICQIFFRRPEGYTCSRLEKVVETSTRTLGNFWFFRQVCKTLGSDDTRALELGALASGIFCIAEQTIFFLEKRHELQHVKNIENNIMLSEEKKSEQQLSLEENSKRVEMIAFAIIAAAVSLSVGYPLRVSAAISATIGSMVLVDSFIQQTLSPNHQFLSLSALIFSGRIAGGLVSSLL